MSTCKSINTYGVIFRKGEYYQYKKVRNNISPAIYGEFYYHVIDDKGTEWIWGKVNFYNFFVCWEKREEILNDIFS